MNKSHFIFSIIKSKLLGFTATNSYATKKIRKIADIFDNPQSFDGFETARQKRFSQNNVHTLASILGVPSEDVSYLELKFQKMLSILKYSEVILRLYFEVIKPIRINILQK